ncbi:MAG: 1,2-phenylacetyl-CoA epoxidase subunit PaaC [Frankiaceae bacterium]
MSDRALFELCLRLGDTALVLGHRLSEWSSKAPTLEEDIALSNVALDLIGQARVLLAHAGQVEGAGRDEDALAYLRDAGDYRNLLLVEQPNGDFAATMLRQFLHDARAVELWPALASSTDATIAGLAAKAAKEAAYHVEHSASWVIRLGDGTDESHRRMLAALDELWMLTGEPFTDDDVDRELAGRGVSVLPSSLAPAWRERVAAVLDEATLPVPPFDAWMQSGGLTGRHTEHLGYLLAELQFLQRAYPGATW